MLRALPASVLALSLSVAAVEAQVRWRPDPAASLAWWQVDPHMNHLWATTCPREPSWRPGEGRSGGWTTGGTHGISRQGYAAVSDTTIVPLFPRPRVRAVCDEAVSGWIMVGDTAQWTGVRGEVVVKAKALFGGDTRRDEFMRETVLETNRFPDIRFQIDSLINVKQDGDTLRATAVGVFTTHGVSQPMKAGVRAWNEAGGVRVTGKFSIWAGELVPVYKMSRVALGLGVATQLWHSLFMGVDLLLRPEGLGAN
jgi:hypothetical protein